MITTMILLFLAKMSFRCVFCMRWRSIDFQTCHYCAIYMSHKKNMRKMERKIQFLDVMTIFCFCAIFIDTLHCFASSMSVEEKDFLFVNFQVLPFELCSLSDRSLQQQNHIVGEKKSMRILFRIGNSIKSWKKNELHLRHRRLASFHSNNDENGK